MKKKILYIAPDIRVKGGISSVIKSYLISELSMKYKIFRVSSHRDGNKVLKIFTALCGMISAIFCMTLRKIDIVHIHGSDVVSSLRKYLFLKVINSFKCKIIYHFHGASFMEQYALKPTLWQNRLKYLFSKSDLVICLSKSWENKIHEIVPTAKTIVLKNAVSLPSDFHHLSEEKDYSVNLIFLGLIGERKGVFDLLKVVERLKKSGNNIKLFIGGNGEVARLQSMIKSLLLEETVYFMGWITDEKKAGLFRRSDIFVLPSYGEGMPMSILEAMSYGLPVISTNIGGIPDLVKDNETGFLIQPGDLDAMYEKLELLIKDKKLRACMGKNAREMIETDYNLDLNISKLDTIYQNLLETGQY